jgi:murein DD-endopeptidase MepM/ murein hydrolase activator NlpD
VSRAEFEPGGFGNFVLLRHPWGESIYAHLDANGVVPGQVISRGQFVGYSGNSGGSTGPHLHFAIRVNPYDRRDGWGGFSDPLPYVPPKSFRLPSKVLVADGGRSALAQPTVPATKPSGMGNTPSYQRA